MVGDDDDDAVGAALDPEQYLELAASGVGGWVGGRVGAGSTVGLAAVTPAAPLGAQAADVDDIVD